MTIVFFSNFLNHHQVLISDELYRLTKGHYFFVALEPMPESFVRSGYPSFDDRPYLIKAFESDINREKAKQLALESEVAIFGALSLNYQVLRSRKTSRMSFEVSERWLKKGWLNMLSPNLLKNQWRYHTLFYRKPVYKLCSSAFAAADQYKMHSYINRCYKWGYFTQVDDDFNVEVLKQGASTEESTPIMWCSRFLQWKHPELPVILAEKLKRNGYKFHIDMFGGGEKMDMTRELIAKCEVRDCVTLRGNLPNADMIEEMRKHKIFLFTSDKNEGWGAVLNESMAKGCVPVVSNAIGSAPFLVEDGVNGFLFDSPKSSSGLLPKKIDVDEHALDSLYEKVIGLLENPKKRNQMAVCAYQTMKEIWSPQNAARNLIQLIDDLQNGHETTIKVGPCSKAHIL